MQKKLFIIPIAVVVVLAFFVEALFILVPARVVEDAVQKRIHEEYGLVMEAGSFEKVFPLGYEAKGVRLKSTLNSGSLYLTRVRVRFSFMSLLSMKPGLLLSGNIYGGTLRGKAGQGMRGAYARINIIGAAVPTLKAFVVIEPGRADIQLNITTRGKKSCPEGYIKARAKGGRIKALSFMGFRIPEGVISDEGLDITLTKCKAFVKSAWIKSASFSAKANGVIGLASPPAHAPLNLRFEFSPKGKLMEDLNKLSFLRPYRRGSGHYRAAIRGTPSSPLITAE